MVGTGSTWIFPHPARLRVQPRALISLSRGRVGAGSECRLGSGLHRPGCVRAHSAAGPSGFAQHIKAIPLSNRASGECY